MSHDAQNRSKDPIERLGDFTVRAQAIGCVACAAIGFAPAAVILGAGTALDHTGNTIYKQAKARIARGLGRTASQQPTLLSQTL